MKRNTTNTASLVYVIADNTFRYIAGIDHNLVIVTTRPEGYEPHPTMKDRSPVNRALCFPTKAKARAWMKEAAEKFPRHAANLELDWEINQEYVADIPYPNPATTKAVAKPKRIGNVNLRTKLFPPSNPANVVQVTNDTKQPCYAVLSINELRQMIIDIEKQCTAFNREIKGSSCGTFKTTVSKDGRGELQLDSYALTHGLV